MQAMNCFNARLIWSERTLWVARVALKQDGTLIHGPIGVHNECSTSVCCVGALFPSIITKSQVKWRLQIAHKCVSISLSMNWQPIQHAVKGDRSLNMSGLKKSRKHNGL